MNPLTPHKSKFCTWNAWKFPFLVLKFDRHDSIFLEFILKVRMDHMIDCVFRQNVKRL